MHERFSHRIIVQDNLIKMLGKEKFEKIEPKLIREYVSLQAFGHVNRSTLFRDYDKGIGIKGKPADLSSVIVFSPTQNSNILINYNSYIYSYHAWCF